VFNCQMGRGRTTTGMVIAAMMQKCKQLQSPTTQPQPEEIIQEEHTGLYRGEYKAILREIRVLDQGVTVKKFCDDIIDICSVMQNLRQDIATLKGQAESADTLKQKNFVLKRGINYLKRYFLLIAFASYLQSPNKQRFENSFEKWMRSHTELYSILQNADLT